MKKLLFLFFAFLCSTVMFADDVLYDFSAIANYPSGFPTSGKTATEELSFTMSNGASFSVHTANKGSYYANNYSGSYALLFGKNLKPAATDKTIANTAYIKFPGKEGYKITKIVIQCGPQQAKSCNANIFDNEYTAVSKEAVAGASAELTFNITNAEENTAYYYAASRTLAAGKNFQVKKATVTYTKVKSFDLTVGSSEWASMYLDFAAEVPEDVTVYYAASVDNGIITLKSVEAGEVLPAKTGVLVNGSSCTFKASTAEAADVTGNLFEGVTTATACEARTVWVLNTASTAELGDPVLSLYTGTSLGANKAYLPASKVAGAKALKLVFEDNTATGINAISNATANSVAYNLAGQRVAANAKGIVIMNGKKFINK